MDKLTKILAVGPSTFASDHHRFSVLISIGCNRDNVYENDI